MRLIAAASVVFVLALASVMPALVPAPLAEHSIAKADSQHSARVRAGRAIFRFDTFGDEQLWTDVLRMLEVLPAVDPATALAVGLKVAVEALPAAAADAVRAGAVDAGRVPGVGARRAPATVPSRTGTATSAWVRWEVRETSAILASACSFGRRRISSPRSCARCSNTS